MQKVTLGMSGILWQTHCGLGAHRHVAGEPCLGKRALPELREQDIFPLQSFLICH